MSKNLYCYDKFNQIFIDVENRFLYNCCHAYPERLNIEECEKDPTKIIIAPKQNRKLPVVLSVEEIDMILNSFDDNRIIDIRDKALISILYSCGLRVSELINLSLTNLFIDDDII